MNMLLALSIAIAAGLAVSRLARLVRLPNVTAFLVGGLIIGPSVLGILPRDMLDGFSVITEAALGFIAYSIGAEFKMSYLKRIGAKPLTITVFEGLGAVVLVDVVLIGCSLAGIPGFDLPMCVALGAIAAATAPAATLMVIRQYKARGPVSEMLLPVVAMDDALGLIAFAISMNIAQTLQSGAAMTVQGMLVSPLLEIVGSVVLGAALGLLLSLLARFFRSRGNKLALTIAFVFLALALCDLWGLSNLLCIMMIGAVMTNLCPAASVIIEQTDRFDSSAVSFVLCHFRRRAGFVRPAHGGTGGRLLCGGARPGQVARLVPGFPPGESSSQCAKIPGLHADSPGGCSHRHGAAGAYAPSRLRQPHPGRGARGHADL